MFQSWADQLAAADQPLDLWYEHIWAPDVDHRAIEGAPDDIGPIVGRDALRAYLADWYETFADLTVVPEEFIDAGPGRVIVAWRVTGRRGRAGCQRSCGLRSHTRSAPARSCEGAST